MTTTSSNDGLAGGQHRGLPDAGPAGGSMTRLQLIGLGWRMSLATRDGRRRLLLAGSGASLAMLVLLAGLAVVHARSAQQDRRDARAPAAVEQTPTDGIAVVADRSGFGGTTWFRGIPVDVVTAVPIGAPPPPPGLDAFPEPGQIAASPAFTRLHADDPLFAARYPGEVVATIGPTGLAGPNEVFAWVAIADAPDTYDASGYGLPEWQAQAEAGDRETADLMIPLGVLLFVLPVLILVGTSTRLGSAQRDQRMAAMRLVGATPGEVRLVSAAEAGGIAAVGVLGGLALFAALRPLVGLLPWRPGLFPTDLAPPPLLVAALALALPVLGVAAGSLSQRRVVTSPLGVTRRAAPRAPRRWRLVPLAGGVALLLVLLVFPNLIKAEPAVVYVLLLGGAGLTLLGLVLATPQVGAMTASALLRWLRLPLAGQLGARRVQADPTSAGRLVTGTAVLVFIATWLLSAFLPVLNQASTGYLDRESTHLRPGTVSGWSQLDTIEQLRAIQGVSAVAPVLQAEPTQTTEEDDDWTGTPTIGDCAAISPLFTEPLPQCAPGTAYPIGAQPTNAPIRVIDPIKDRRIDIGQPRFDRVADYLDTEDGYALSAALMTLGLGGAYLLPASNAPADLPADWTVRMLVATDGSPQAVESVKNVMTASSGTVPLTDDDQHHAGTSDQALYQLLLLAYLAAIGLIAVVSLAITAADDLRNRARAMASLAAAGTPTRTLRRASLVQLLLTLLPAVALALTTATIAAFMYSQLWLVDSGPDTPRPFQPEVIAAVGAGSVLIVLAAYTLTLPTLRNAVDLRGLRTT
jgi:hypothetical protein